LLAFNGFFVFGNPGLLRPVTGNGIAVSGSGLFQSDGLFLRLNLPFSLLNSTNLRFH
jgi:hypothetical protein